MEALVHLSGRPSSSIQCSINLYGTQKSCDSNMDQLIDWAQNRDKIKVHKSVSMTWPTWLFHQHLQLGSTVTDG